MLNKLMKLKNKKGFTLVELIVVIAIIAILTAIIVPLVGRYSAQARYTTLQDAASTISSSANTALSDGNQIGALTGGYFQGSKTDAGVLTVKWVATGAEVKSETEAKTANNDTADKRAVKRLYSSLYNALPNNCCFQVDVTASSVAGVFYVTGTSALAAAKITPVEGFDKAYEDENQTAVGVSGKYIPASKDAPVTFTVATKTTTPAPTTPGEGG